MDFSDLYSWGIPTALSIIKCNELDSDLKIIASGGIKTSMDVIKSLVIGGDFAAISGEVLSYLTHGGYDKAYKYLNELTHKIKVIMLLMGKRNLKELKGSNYKISGKLKELI